MLLVSGILELERPIGSVVATGGEGYTGGIERFGLLSESKFKCRSVYLPVIRGRAFESMDVFDGVDGSMVVGKRDQTTVPTQSLYLLNSPYVMDLAISAAKRVTGEEPQLESDSGEVLLNPVVLVEVLSDATEAYDRGKKFEHYRTIPSLKHYVLIAQDRHSIDCFTRSADGSWNLTSCQGLDGKIKLEALDSELVGAEVYDKVVFAS